MRKDDYNISGINNHLYRESIFGLVAENLRTILGVNDATINKINVAIISIQNLENILDTNSVYVDDTLISTFDERLLRNIDALLIDDFQNINLPEYISFLNSLIDEKKLNNKQKLAKIFNYIEKWIDINSYLPLIKEKQLKRNFDGYTRVFLSYAYEDRLYTIGLFFYFLRYKVYLYVDWMHNDKIEVGCDLKLILIKELTAAIQLLFLDTKSSQLQIVGNSNIRQWCAWEIGSFNTLNDCKNKFYLSIYESTDTEKRLNDNLMLNDFTEFYEVKDGFLVGIER